MHLPTVDAWLNALGLGQYAAAFRANAVDGDVLSNLTDDDLKTLGVAALGHRKKLLRAIAQLGKTPTAHATAGEAGNVPTPTAGAAERRQLTVMFVDLVGSTALAGQLDPEDMRELIHGYQNTVAGEIARFEGHVAQFLGDGVLAYFGWPRAHEDDAERALCAGLAVTAATARLQTPAGVRLQTRTGIATGLVVVGDLIDEGIGQRHAVVGETPNLAARLQALAEPGTVVIAATTRQLAGDLFVLRDLGPQVLKGVSEPTAAYAVVAERTLGSRYAARHPGAVSVLVGRERELTRLTDAWHQSGASNGRAMLLTGEPGIGKSRITEALIESVRAEPHVLLRIQCSPYHVDSPLYPVIQHLRLAADLGDSLGDAERLSRLVTLLSRAGDDTGAAVPLIAALLGIDPGPQYAPDTLRPQQRRDRTLAMLVDQLVGLARLKPVLWVIEDAHWIDPTTLELIELALGRIRATRVLALVTTRPGPVGSLDRHPLVERVDLDRLDRSATQALVAQITDGKRLPDRLLDEIVTRTDGIPLFIEEITRMLIESGLLRERGDEYEFDGTVTALAIPATLQDSLMARLDRLQPAKEVAQTAAVIGRSFDHRTLSELAGLSALELDTAMHKLVSAGLLFRRGTPPHATYQFKHALVRDAAYETLLRTRRLALHARLVDVLEARGNAAPEVKAQHAELAGLTARALDYWEQAGTEALARTAYKEACAHLEKAIRLCGTAGATPDWKRREQRLQVQRGQALIASEGYAATATVDAFDRALTLATEIGDIALELPAAYGQLASTYVGGRSSIAAAERFHALAARQSESGPRLVAARHLGMARFHAGRLHEALELYRSSIADFDDDAHRELALRYGQDNLVAVDSYLAILLWVLGLPEQALRTADQALERAHVLTHPVSTAYALSQGVAPTCICLRRPERVALAARECLQLTEQLPMPVFHAFALIHLGWALSQSDAAAGLAEFAEGMREKFRCGTRRWAHFDHSLVADAHARGGRHDEALASIASAFDSVQFGGDMVFLAELHRQRALLLLRSGTGSREAAEAELRHALNIASEQSALSFQLRTARDLARLLGERSERQQGVDLLAPVYAAFTEGFATLDLVESRSLLDALQR